MQAPPFSPRVSYLLVLLCALGGCSRPAALSSGAVVGGAGAPSQGAGVHALVPESSTAVSVAGTRAGDPGAGHAAAPVGGAQAGEPGAAGTTAAGRAGNAAGAGQPSAGAAAGSGGHALAGVAAGSGGHASGGASGADAPSTHAFHACPSDGLCKIMPFGDSITDGYNQDTPGGYRIELFRLAHAAGKPITFVGTGENGPMTVDGAPFPRNHEGHSGWTIAPAGGRSGISTLVSTVMPKYTPHIVLLMIGTNDAIDNYDMMNAPTRLGQLIDSVYAQLPDVAILVAQLIPARGDVSKGDDAELNARIQRYNEAVPAVVKARADAGKHILSVDMHKPFDGVQGSLLEDQWHPNADGYAKLGSAWYMALQALL